MMKAVRSSSYKIKLTTLISTNGGCTIKKDLYLITMASQVLVNKTDGFDRYAAFKFSRMKIELFLTKFLNAFLFLNNSRQFLIHFGLSSLSSVFLEGSMQVLR